MGHGQLPGHASPGIDTRHEQHRFDRWGPAKMCVTSLRHVIRSHCINYTCLNRFRWTCKVSLGINITYKSTELCCIIILSHILSYSIILLRNLNNYEGISRVQEEMRTGWNTAGALKSGSPGVRSEGATWDSSFAVVAKLHCAGPLLGGVVPSGALT